MFVIYLGLFLSKSEWEIVKKVELCLKESMSLIWIMTLIFYIIEDLLMTRFILRWILRTGLYERGFKFWLRGGIGRVLAEFFWSHYFWLAYA